MPYSAGFLMRIELVGFVGRYDGVIRPNTSQSDRPMGMNVRRVYIIIAISEVKIMRRSLPFSLILTLCTGFSSVASAKDIQAIRKVCDPCLYGNEFSMLCSQDDPWFLIDTRGPRGHAIKYAEHVKDEAIASLTE